MNMKNLLLIFLCVSTISQASVVVEVKPVTQSILLIHFDDGYAIHHKRGQQRTQESVVISPLDIIKAMLKTSYMLSSVSDANYSTSLNPIDIGRKSKPTEFALLCQTYNNGCINTDPDHAKEHWVYLFLPFVMKSGVSYKLTLDGLATTNTVDFIYSEVEMHSETIHVNNIGYSTTAPVKYAYLYHWMGDKGGLDLVSFAGKEFSIFDIDKTHFVFTGSIAFRKAKTNIETGQATDTPDKNFSSADVYECDFSSFNTPGNYKIVVSGIGSSFPFKIDADVYQEAFYWTMKGLYHNRSGIELKTPFTDFIRPAPHHVKLTPGFSNRLKYSAFRSFDLSTPDGGQADKAKIESASKGHLDNSFGWYQDAGDWDGYYSHSHIPAYLMFLYEAGKDKFTDGELNIPESGNGIADVLDEASWLLRYFKRAKDEIKDKGWGTGGVPGARVFGDLWGPDSPNDVGQASWQDTGRDWYLLGEDVWTSYKYAATTAQLAYILEADGKSDPQGVDWKKEAIDAYAWAIRNTLSSDEISKQDVELKDIRLYASAALYRLTGEGSYHTEIYKILTSFSGSLDQGKQDFLFGAWLYLMSGNQSREGKILDKVKTLVATSADKYLANSADIRACRWGGDFNFPMLIGQGTTPMVQAGVYGYLLNKNNPILGEKYNSDLHTTADYFLGTNPLNTTWISGVGERYPVGLFHLDWWYSDKADANNSLPVLKGVVPYGQWRYDTGLGPLGWWNPNWAYSDLAGNPRIYPSSVTNWPGHERWFDMRNSPLTSEFTIHQNTVVAAFVYGFLTAGKATEIKEGIITGIEKKNNDESVTVFPNPTNDVLFIESVGYTFHQIEVFSLDGNRLLTMHLSSDLNNATIDVGHLANAVYLLKLKDVEGKIKSTKFIIKK
jgi:endoglucanase